jgi:hypothetical protein
VIYLSIYLCLLTCGIISKSNRALRAIFYYVSLFGLFFFVGFRYKVGCDWAGYLNIYSISRYFNPSDPEVSFWALNRLLNDYELEYPYINIIASGCFFVGIHVLARRQPDKLAIVILAFPILIINLAMSGIRQAMALGILCFAFNAFNDKSILRYVSTVVVAVTFHTSAAIFLLLSPVVRGNFSPRRIAIGGILALPALYLLVSSSSFGVYSQRYIGSGLDAFGAPFRTGLVALTGGVFLWWLDSRWKKLFPLDYKLIKISSYIMLAVFFLSFLSSVGGDRLGYYMSMIQLVILARLPLLVQGRYRNVFSAIPYAVFGLALSVWVFKSSLFEACYVPYQIWW